MTSQSYRGLLGMAFDSVFEVNEDGIITDFQTFSGQGEGHGFGESFIAIVPPQYRATLEQKFQNQKRDPSASFNFVYTDDARGRFELLVEHSGPEGYRAALRNVDNAYVGKPASPREPQTDILDAMDDYISIMDTHKKAVFLNEGGRRMCGYTKEDAPCIDIDMAHPRDIAEKIRTDYLPLAEKDGSVRFESAILHKDGSRIPVDQTILLLKDASDEVAGYATIIKDLREIHANEIEMEQRLRQQELVASLSLNFASTEGFDQQVNQALAMITEFVGVDRTYLFKDHPEGLYYQCTHEWTADGFDPMIEQTQHITYAPDIEFYNSLKAGPYIAVDDTSKLPPGKFKSPKSHHIMAMINTPIYIGKTFWGFLGVDCFRFTKAWTVSEKNLLKSIAGILSTVMEKQEVQVALSKTEQKFGSLLENVPVGVFWKDMNRIYQGCNRVFEEYLEAPAADYVGKPDPDILAHRSIAEIVRDEDMRLIQNGGEISDEYAITNKDGTQRWVRTNKLLLGGSELEEPYILGALLDITERRLAEEKTKEALTNAENASRAKGEFLARMSHEIRTPMNAIIGMNAIAAKSDEMEKVRYCLGKIDAASKQLLGIINDILDMSKIEAEKLEIVPNEFSFEQMLQDVCNVVSVRMDEKNQEFTIELGDILYRNMLADELRLSQVMINLLTNASKFTPDGGKIKMDISFANLSADTSRLRVEVADNGIGIPESERERLFSLFEQADGGTTRKFGGTGLGLAICKKIVELMGGQIWVESEEGCGSTFIFELDVGWGETNARIASAKGSLDKDAVHVLAIDDSEDVLFYFKEVMQSFDIRCDFASSGADAVETFRAALSAGDAHNIIFVDWNMPGMNGIETTRRIKEMEQDNAAVIMISATQWADIGEEATSAGVSRFLPKPLLPSSLLNTITEIMGITHATAAATPEDEFQFRGKRIILAEDVEINREIIHSILDGTGVEITDAENGQLAVDLFRAAPDRYDLILMDLQMPVMDGYRATEQIRGSGLANAASFPIVAMTANAFQEDINKCLACGMNGHIAKPIDIQDLMDKLEFYLLGQ